MGNLKIEFPSQGWVQILTARREILDAFDRAREQARIHEVETFHGRVAEASSRKWLSEFLPKRYGVTSGYVVSPGLPSSVKAPHFDVIIYDQLESPILWVEETADSSRHGRSLAVPVEHVRAVLEVKSHLTARTAREALQHLGDLAPLMQGLDAATDRYRLYLPPTFSCGLLFVELRVEDATSEVALAALVEGIGLRGFFGGVVLRGEGHTLPHTGRLSITRSDSPVSSIGPATGTSLLEIGMSASVPVADSVHIGAMLDWSEMGFARFAFDLVAMLQGTFDGRLSSFYGFGSSWGEMVKQSKSRDS